MSEVVKTIKMPKATWEKWEAALLSGEYEQGTGRMFDGRGYCCLGVLQHCLTGSVEADALAFLSLPTRKWLDDNGITFDFAPDTRTRVPTVEYNGIMRSVSALNDREVSFVDLVEAMRPHVETY